MGTRRTDSGALAPIATDRQRDERHVVAIRKETTMKYQPMDFSSLLGMKGFSDKLLKDHFGLYQGYVTHTNELLQKLEKLGEDGKLGSVEHSELRRRLGWEFDGMRLHELYFGNLGGNGKPPATGEAQKAIKSSFGSYDRFIEEFKAVAKLRGVGWAVLYLDAASDRLLNLWIDEHDIGHPTGCSPILVMDAWEHAFMTDYGTDRGSYIETFVANLDWKEIDKRLAVARSVALTHH
jgi:superoxide dismutase, Fe-Mn family